MALKKVKDEKTAMEQAEETIFQKVNRKNKGLETGMSFKCFKNRKSVLQECSERVVMT